MGPLGVFHAPLLTLRSRISIKSLIYTHCHSRSRIGESQGCVARARSDGPKLAPINSPGFPNYSHSLCTHSCQVYRRRLALLFLESSRVACNTTTIVLLGFPPLEMLIGH